MRAGGVVSGRTMLLVEPVKHRGKAALVNVFTDSRDGLAFIFQRQRFVVVVVVVVGVVVVVVVVDVVHV